MDIVDFLAARLEEDEAVALRLLGDRSVSASGKWYESRLLRECEAKRRLLAIIESARQAALSAMLTDPPEDPERIADIIDATTRSLHALALPYSDHPDFEPGWGAP